VALRRSQPIPQSRSRLVRAAVLADPSATAVAREEHDPPDVVVDLKVPVLGLYGGQDGFIPLAQIDEMKAKLAASGGASKIIVYPDSGHGFFGDYRPDYNRADAEASWSATTGWLKEHGV
jgi:carboxymethylenebutenolidase